MRSSPIRHKWVPHMFDERRALDFLAHNGPSSLALVTTCFTGHAAVARARQAMRRLAYAGHVQCGQGRKWRVRRS